MTQNGGTGKLIVRLLNITWLGYSFDHAVWYQISHQSKMFPLDYVSPCWNLWNLYGDIFYLVCSAQLQCIQLRVSHLSQRQPPQEWPSPWCGGPTGLSTSPSPAAGVCVYARTRVCVCVCVCVSVCVCSVCVCVESVYVYVWFFLCISECVCVCWMCVFTSLSVCTLCVECVYKFISVFIMCLCVCACVCVSMHMFLCVSMHVCVRVWVSINCMFVQACMYI